MYYYKAILLIIHKDTYSLGITQMPGTGSEWDFIVLILRTLDEEGSMNQTHLAELTGSNKNKISRYIEALVHRGLIEKVIDPGPPRQALVKLTNHGKCIVACLKKEV